MTIGLGVAKGTTGVALHILAFTLWTAGCEPSGTSATATDFKDVPSAIRALKNAESLSALQVPASARFLGWYEEGLRVHIAFDMPADATDEFLRQPLFEQLNEESVRWQLEEMPKLGWWRPNSGSPVARRNGMLPDKRALHMAINGAASGGEDTPRVTVLMYKFNI